MKPILFNTEMVRAISEGRKTVTRRVLKLPSHIQPQDNGLFTLYADGTCYENERLVNVLQYLKAPYKVNDILYVRETWSELSYGYEYKADGKMIDHLGNSIKYRPSIHMPKEAARIFLRVTDVRVERLQDMTLEDFFNEGISIDEDEVLRELNLLDEADSIAKVKFRQLWDSTIKKDQAKYYSWSVDPYVWVIEFEDISNQKDQLI